MTSYLQGETEAPKDGVVCPGPRSQAERPRTVTEPSFFQTQPLGGLMVSAAALQGDPWTWKHHRLRVWAPLCLWLMEMGLWGG